MTRKVGDLRSQVEKRLGHSRFRLVYKGADKWNIIAADGKYLGYIIDRRPYSIHLKKKPSGFLDWLFGIE